MHGVFQTCAHLAFTDFAAFSRSRPCTTRLVRMKTSLCFAVLMLHAIFANAATVEPQPFLAATQRLIEATTYLGSPFSKDELATLTAAIASNDEQGVTKAEAALDAHALFVVTITAEQRVKVSAGAALPVLDEAGWRQYFVRVDNQAGVTAKLVVSTSDLGSATMRRTSRASTAGCFNRP